MIDVGLDAAELRALEKQMRELAKPGEVSKKATREAGRFVIKQARTKIRSRTGNLAKSLGVRMKKLGMTGYVAQVAPRTGKGLRYDGYYGAMVEFGTDAHEIPGRKKGGQLSRNKKALSIDGDAVHSVTHPGAPPQPFMRPAFDENKEALVRTWVDAYGKWIDRAVRK